VKGFLVGGKNQQGRQSPNDRQAVGSQKIRSTKDLVGGGVKNGTDVLRGRLRIIVVTRSENHLGAA